MEGWVGTWMGWACRQVCMLCMEHVHVGAIGRFQAWHPVHGRSAHRRINLTQARQTPSARPLSYAAGSRRWDIGDAAKKTGQERPYQLLLEIGGFKSTRLMQQAYSSETHALGVARQPTARILSFGARIGDADQQGRTAHAGPLPALQLRDTKKCSTANLQIKVHKVMALVLGMDSCLTSSESLAQCLQREIPLSDYISMV